MPEWSAHLRTRLAPLRLSPAREAEIVDELSQHLDDRYEALRAAGHDADAAVSLALEELHGHDTLAREMRALRQARIAGADRRRRGATRPHPGPAAGPALRGAHAAEAAGLHGGRRPHPRARDRREHRGLQPGQRDALPAAAGRGRRAAGLHVSRRQRRFLVPAVRDAARPRPVLRRTGRLGRHHGEPATRATPRSSCRASSPPATSSRCSACSRHSDAC